MKKHASLIFLIPALVLICSAAGGTESVRDDDLISQSERQHTALLDRLGQITEGQKSVLEQLTELRSLSAEQSGLHQKDFWHELQSLNREALMLLRAGETVWDEYTALTEGLAGSLDSASAVPCSDARSCTLAEIRAGLAGTSMQNLLQTARQAAQERQYLSDLETEMDAVISQGKSASTYADLLDALLRVNTLSAQTLGNLSRQLNTLISLSAGSRLGELLTVLSEQREEERFVSSGYQYSNRHFRLRVDPHQAVQDR